MITRSKDLVKDLEGVTESGCGEIDQRLVFSAPWKQSKGENV